MWLCVSVTGNISQNILFSQKDSPQKSLHMVSYEICTGINALCKPKSDLWELYSEGKLIYNIFCNY